MEKEDVLVLEYTQINDEYTVATIVYQNEDVLKRGVFEDIELNIDSNNSPVFFNNSNWLCILGSDLEKDKIPIIIPNEKVKDIKDRVKKLNEKYGTPKKLKPKLNETYYFIRFIHNDVVGKYTFNDDVVDRMLYNKNLIFKTKEEAQYVANKMLENVDKWRKEYQKKN